MQPHIIQLRAALPPVADFQIILTVDTVLIAERLTAIHALTTRVAPASTTKKPVTERATFEEENAPLDHHNPMTFR
jgi:hypothetical protein